MACNRLKRAHFTCLGTPNGLGSFLEKHTFDPFLTHFGPFFCRKTTHFQGILQLGRGQNGLQWAPKWAHFTCLGTPNGLGSFLEKIFFDLFLTHSLSQKRPFSRHFGILGGPKRATTRSKCAKNTCFGIPCGARSFLKKVVFFAPRGPCHPFWHPPLWATSCSLPRPTGPRCGGLGVG